MRFRIGALLFVALFEAAVANSDRGGDDGFGLFALIAAFVVVFTAFGLKRLPRWQQVVVRFAYVCFDAVFLFLVWVFVTS